MWPKKNRKNGQFMKTPPGKKTPRMREVEANIGMTIEKAFKKFYWGENYGQKKMARLLGVSKNLLFSNNMRGSRRSWTRMLGIKTRSEVSAASKPKQRPRNRCELCLKYCEHLEKAHWVPHSKGGSGSSWNLINACPNCHTALDHGNRKMIERARAVALFKVAKKFTEGKYLVRDIEPAKELLSKVWIVLDAKGRPPARGRKQAF